MEARGHAAGSSTRLSGGRGIKTSGRTLDPPIEARDPARAIDHVDPGNDLGQGAIDRRLVRLVKLGPPPRRELPERDGPQIDDHQEFGHLPLRLAQLVELHVAALALRDVEIDHSLLADLVEDLPIPVVPERLIAHWQS